MEGMDRPSPGEARRLLAGLARDPSDAARFLLGQVLVRRLGRRRVAVRIVETEAYLGEGDAAAHSFRGRTPRTEPLWGPAGTVYIYFIYGMHHCLNLAAEEAGRPGCVLIRAAEPLPGSGLQPGDCRGPGRLCRSLQLDTRLSGSSVFAPRGELWLRAGRPPGRVGVSPRVGIRRAADWPLRFFDALSPALSGPGRAARARP
jgi:DNA-3-methyladenine glycosylase